MFRTKLATFIALCLASAAPMTSAGSPANGEQARQDAEDVRRSKQAVEHHLSKGADSKPRQHRENMERARERSEQAEEEEIEEEIEEEDLDHEGTASSK